MARSLSSLILQGTPTLLVAPSSRPTSSFLYRRSSRPQWTLGSSRMPCLSGRFDPGIGPLINVGILKPGTITPSTPPTGQIAAFPALIDTGATSTCISPAIAQSVGLQPIGLRPMVSATHAVPVNVYLADLILPFGSAGLRSEEHTSELQSPDHLVCRLLLRPPPTSTLFPYTTLFRSTGQIAAFPALIDTGATSTCISPAIAQSVGLQPIGLRPMVSATHAVPVNVYLADLILPFGSAGL